jgi:uncharacterized membrane protein YGL010W
MAREGGLIAWQWRDYGRNHTDKVSLVLHMVGVPMFIAGTLAAFRGAVYGNWLGVAVALVVVVVGFALQGIGHRREAEQPVPFDGPADFVARIFTEQFVTFPRFVLTGHWLRHLAGMRSKE